MFKMKHFPKEIIVNLKQSYSYGESSLSTLSLKRQELDLETSIDLLLVEINW